MPRRSRKQTRKAPRRKVRGRKFAGKRSPGTMGNMCTVTETVSDPQNLNGNTGYTSVFQIANYPRALALQPYFQEYSLKAVRIVHEPLVPLGSAPTMAEIALYGPARKSNFYWVRNADGNLPSSLPLPTILEMGARAIPFGSSTSGNVVIKYQPNLIEAILQAGGTGGSKRAIKDRWLSCRDSTMDTLDNTAWQGHFTFIDDPLNVPPSTGVLPVSRTVVELVWQFRRPYIEAGSGSPAVLIST